MKLNVMPKNVNDIIWLHYCNVTCRCHPGAVKAVHMVWKRRLIFPCVSFSGRSWLKRRCIRLHGADDLEDQGGCKGEKMTSDPTAPLPSAELPARTGSLCVGGAGRRVGRGKLRLESSFQHTKPVRSPSFLLPVRLKRTISLFKAIGAQIDSVSFVTSVLPNISPNK